MRQVLSSRDIVCGSCFNFPEILSGMRLLAGHCAPVPCFTENDRLTDEELNGIYQDL